MEDTIAAITTALGSAGVGIIRISGRKAAEIADKVFRGKSQIPLVERRPFTVAYGHIYDEKQQLLDEALALTMWAPHSFTGEDVVELQCHGGMVVLRKTLELLLMNGARLAQPGEFSKRAFLNGRLDLSQAESILEIITAKTEKGLQAAAANLKGGISEKVKILRHNILEIIAYLEADIDFPEEDIERLDTLQLTQSIREAEQELTQIIGSYQSGKIMREGIKTALVGKPNVGKSSLLNALLQEKRAIVTDVPGTTRDVIQEYYNLNGIPLILNDTAGLRQTEDIVEKIGVEMTREVIREADLILYILDSTAGFTEEDRETLREFPAHKTLVIVNKIDLLEGQADKVLGNNLEGYRIVSVSAKEQLGLEDLEKTIMEMFFAEGLQNSDQPILTNLRQKEALVRALEMVNSAAAGVREGLAADLIVIDLRSAWEIMGEVSGESLGEDIIDQIFSQFCLGK